MSQKSSALSILFEGGEGPLQIEFTNICRQITTTSLVKLDRKRGAVTTSPQCKSIVHREGGVKRDEGGGGGGSFMWSLHEPGDM